MNFCQCVISSRGTINFHFKGEVILTRDFCRGVAYVKLGTALGVTTGCILTSSLRICDFNDASFLAPQSKCGQVHLLFSIERSREEDTGLAELRQPHRLGFR